MRRLDYLLIPNDLQFEVKSCEILAPFQNDHSPAFLKLKSFVDEGTRGPGHWKFNNCLVNDATFIDEMHDLINKVSSNFNEPSLNLPELSNDDRLSCEGKLVLQECWEALNSMKNCKTLANDGLPKKFCVCFFKQLGKLLVSTLFYSFDHGELSTSQKQAVIVLI